MVSLYEDTFSYMAKSLAGTDWHWCGWLKVCEPTVNSLSHQVPLLMCGNEKNSTVMQHECNTLSEVTLPLPPMSLTLRSETAGKQRRLFKTCFERSFGGSKKGGLCKEHIGRG